MAQLEQPRHYAGIDGLRALSCLAIIAMHVLANTEYAVSGFLFDTLIPAGTQMVYLFLMISGFGLCCGYLERFQAGPLRRTASTGSGTERSCLSSPCLLCWTWP